MWSVVSNAIHSQIVSSVLSIYQKSKNKNWIYTLIALFNSSVLSTKQCFLTRTSIIAAKEKIFLTQKKIFSHFDRLLKWVQINVVTMALFPFSVNLSTQRKLIAIFVPFIGIFQPSVEWFIYFCHLFHCHTQFAYTHAVANNPVHSELSRVCLYVCVRVCVLVIRSS